MKTQNRHVIDPTWLYRFESVDPLGGLWYNDHEEWVFDRGIGLLSNEAAHALPMDYDERYQKDGRSWHSGCPSTAMMRHWFRREDVPVLLDNGFVLYRYLATEYVHYEFETCFIKETSLTRVLLNPYTPWDATQENDLQHENTLSEYA